MCLSSLSKVIIIIIIIIIIYYYKLIIINFNYHSYNLLDCKILFNPWNNNFDWAGWTDKQNNLFL